MNPIIKRKGLTGFKSTVGNVLANVIRDASRNGNNYIEATGYTTFLYGERQMNSILAPAFHKNTDAMILEYPATRKTGTRNHHASRADYYCLCNKGRSNIYRLFVELKSSWQVLPLRDGFKMANVELYGKACKQICGLINEFRGKNKKFYEAWPIMRASMLTIALTSNPSREYNLTKDDIDDLIEKAWEEFSMNGEMKPNLIGFWKVDDDVRIEQEWENDDARIHGILYVCHIMKPYRVNSNHP